MASIAEALSIAFQYHEAGQLAEAETLYRRILDADPEQATALRLLAVLLCQANAPQEAVGLFRQAVRLTPDDAGLRIDLARALMMAVHNQQAIDTLQTALALQPDHALALLQLGKVMHASNQPAPAATLLQHFLRLAPDHGEARQLWTQIIDRHGRAMTFMRAIERLDQGETAEAVRLFRATLAIDPACGPALSNIAAQSLRQPDNARTLAQRARRADPRHPDIAQILGNVFIALGDDENAIAAYRETLRLSPDHVGAHWNLSHALLRLGDYGSGWDEYEWRWRSPAMNGQHRPFPQPRWEGGDLTGKTILVHAEQGLGDALQFIRFLDRVMAARPEHIYLEAHAPVRPLLECNVDPALVSVISRASDFPGIAGLPDVDCQIPLMSLARLFCRNIEAIPAAVPYLHPPADRPDTWKRRLQESSPDAHLRCGLVWAGRPANVNDARRSMRLAAFAPLAAIPGVTLYSLQVGPAVRELAEFPGPITDLSGDLPDLAEAAAAIAALDLVITVDTAIAHLAGALGRPVWVLLPSNPCWRWMSGRSDSPWYPTARLFRQERPDDWTGPLAAVARALTEAAAPPRS
ncbi:tetratricopeptide repeat protein [Azospirillum soli]|uniref:tetratricopeptide repeat protein n=1 Tax=Azospirillum soli TaxID=1304799 RepID=UPI001AE876D9|nr:tetratricopeptide repeat protein [Azospirillum soli]MBP2315639.1 tetratricopeptide (TPR) repeat protein [Azospirillum soli]